MSPLRLLPRFYYTSTPPHRPPARGPFKTARLSARRTGRQSDREGEGKPCPFQEWRLPCDAGRIGSRAGECALHVCILPCTPYSYSWPLLILVAGLVVLFAHFPVVKKHSFPFLLDIFGRDIEAFVPYGVGPNMGKFMLPPVPKEHVVL
jgi:hypothetical protein